MTEIAGQFQTLSREAQTRALAYAAATTLERHAMFGTLLAELDQLRTTWPKVSRRDVWEAADIPDNDERAGVLVRLLERIGVHVTRHYSDVLSED